MRFSNLQWLFPFVVALHNTEEAIWFPEWTKRAGRWHAPVAPGVFRFAAFALVVLAFALTGLSVHAGSQSAWTYLEFGYMAAMLANVFVPHLLVSLATRRYMPGLGTAVVLILPVTGLLVALALRQGYATGAKAALYSMGVAAALLLCIAALFKAGELLRL